MSTVEMTSSGDRNEIDNIQTDDVPKIKTASLRMLEIADKLESINQQCHILRVENRGNENSILQGHTDHLARVKKFPRGPASRKLCEGAPGELFNSNRQFFHAI